MIRALIVPTKLERKKHSRFKGELEDDAPCGMDSTYHIPVDIQLTYCVFWSRKDDAPCVSISNSYQL